MDGEVPAAQHAGIWRLGPQDELPSRPYPICHPVFPGPFWPTLSSTGAPIQEITAYFTPKGMGFEVFVESIGPCWLDWHLTWLWEVYE